MRARRRRLLCVSHAYVIAVNQVVFERMQQLGWEVHLVTPRRWEDEYRPAGFDSTVLPGLAARARRIPVVGGGRPQRHVYRCRPGAILDAVAPDVAFVEQEPLALATAQWVGALRRRGIPFGLQQAENLDRPVPQIARAIRAVSLPRAAFVAARSPQAAALVAPLVPQARVEVVPHAVPAWPAAPVARRAAERPFTVGYAGRLVPEKGIADLLAATAAMRPAAPLLVVGDGPLRAEVEAAGTPERPVVVRTDVAHDAMPGAYAGMDVLVLPSRTTPTWTEQFGRVLVEALSCSVPVVASDSGEMPWVVASTGGGELFPEGSVADLTRVLEGLRAEPRRRAALAQAGRAVVAATFSEEAVAAQMDRLLAAVADA